MAAPYRKTKQRAAILEALVGTREHPTADQLYSTLKKSFPNLSLGTVYRNLNVLIEMGKVKKLEYGSTFDRFEAASKPHAHLICRECGSIQDYEIKYDPQTTRSIEKETGFQIGSERMDFYGICKSCIHKQ